MNVPIGPHPMAANGWLDRTSRNFHGFHAQRNIRACAACHQEQYCIQCHGSNFGGRTLQSNNPHGANAEALRNSVARQAKRPRLPQVPQSERPVVALTGGLHHVQRISLLWRASQARSAPHDRRRDRCLVVRSTDRYLNEYVPVDESARVWISGFTGSMGEVLITQADAYLFVDGRYWLQAEQEVNAKHWTIERVRLGSGLNNAVAGKLKELAEAHRPKKLRIGFEPERNTIKALARSRKRSAGASPTGLRPISR